MVVAEDENVDILPGRASNGTFRFATERRTSRTGMNVPL
jgi:hypothetical protein